MSSTSPPLPRLDPASLDYVRSLIRDEAGMGLDPSQAYLVESRLLPLARKANAPDLDAFVGLVRGPLGANLRRQVVSAMLPAETSFFRDAAAFACLRTDVLPAVIAARRAERSLAIWCGAASAGQEPYSIAMIIREHFEELLSWTLALVATDPSPERLARARAGRYNQLEVNRGLPPALAAKYFEREGLEWAIVEPLRRMVDFRELNLHKPWPALPAFDIVSMRTVLPALAFDAGQRIVGQVRAVLRPDGFLLADGATPLDGFERLPDERAGCYRAVAL